jgi:hypothetical protein
MTNAFNLSQLANNTNSSGQISLTTGVTGTISSSNISPVTGTGNVVLSISPAFTGTPLSTTAANATNTTQIATTAFAYGTLSAAANGYIKLPNGLIMQWGTSGSLGTNAGATITLPIAYTTVQYNCVATASFASGILDKSAGVTSLTTTNFFLWNNGSGPNVIYWQSIGY